MARAVPVLAGVQFAGLLFRALTLTQAGFERLRLTVVDARDT